MRTVKASSDDYAQAGVCNLTLAFRKAHSPSHNLIPALINKC